MKIEKEISSWSRALYLAFEDDPGNAEAILTNLKKALGKKQAITSSIFKKLERIYLKEKRAELSLAYAMGEHEKDEFKEKIRRAIPSIEKVDDVLDESLLAGFRLKTKDVLVKASLKDVLSKLKNKIYGHN